MAEKSGKRLSLFMISTLIVGTGCKIRTQEVPAANLRDNLRASAGDRAGEGADSDAASAYETVNHRPQLSIDQNQFSFYWGLWRTVTPAEKAAIAAASGESDDSAPTTTSGSLISRRIVAWTVNDCATSTLLIRDQEELFYLDQIEINAQGETAPLREAYRPGWRYFSMGTFDSTLARTDLSMPIVEQLPGERLRDWRNRKFEVEQAWRKEQSRRGQRGEIHFQATHKLYAVPASRVVSAFISFFDYRGNDLEFQGGAFARLSPARWPVYFDERAHKPHSFEEPEIWRAGAPVSSRDFNAVLKWDWCDTKTNVKAVFEPGPGGLPRPGPNRPGRNDRGNADLEIRADQGLMKNTQ
ncbi:MAG: hypothetical protein RIQ81_2016 [Pseudomonadota bacterium]|jgi:hypothetical protein